ncbi:hypothetical protein BGW38_010707 [Lunasporangiospora selenospora]|uniref:Bulb-type lectin domain-containing protein n=1 Tax=Lunasporangiospora selenospora TaxID=979761 RepID=A0A9P6G356_9FUNG|nr:hypothetical protein BGW38_010707 [Lunasporangiospora selenospora]
MLPHNGLSACFSQREYDYDIKATSTFWGINTNQRNMYQKTSRSVVCNHNLDSCDVSVTETLTTFATWNIDSDATFDIKAVKAKVSADHNAQLSTVRSQSYKLHLAGGKTGYIGFGAYWVQVDGKRRSWTLTCCRFGRCTKSAHSEKDYSAYFPRSLPNTTETDGIYNICYGGYDNQRCSPMGMDDISICKGNKGTIISGESLKGCKDKDCTDSSRILKSSNRASWVAIGSDGSLCVNASQDGQSRTLCVGKSMDKKKGPFYGTLHNNGNFCLYTNSGSNYWCSGRTSTDNGQYRAIIQNNGNFVIYTAENNPIWSSGTALGNIPFPYCGKSDGSDKCFGGNPGSRDGKGGEGTCCETSRDCKECCTAGVCNAACNFRRSLLEYRQLDPC